MATTDSKSESAIEASLEPNQRQAFRELIDDYNVAEGLHLQSCGGRHQSECRCRAGPARTAEAAKLGH